MSGGALCLDCKQYKRACICIAMSPKVTGGAMPQTAPGLVQAVEARLDELLEPDMVNAPPHYREGEVECIDAIESALSPSELGGFLKGQVLKYLWRERHKGGLEDLKKARFYLDREIERREGGDGP